MIRSAEEFVSLRNSDDAREQHRAAWDEADEATWLDVIARFPDMRVWVAHNKSVPLSVLRVLATDLDCRVRHMVAAKRKLDAGLFALLAADTNESVRQRLACNGRVPTDVLTLLAQDEEPSVAEAARARL